MARITKVSRENLRAAERVEVIRFDFGYGVKVWVGYRAAFLHGGDGFPLTYQTVGAAERAIRRHRPDLFPTSASSTSHPRVVVTLASESPALESPASASPASESPASESPASASPASESSTLVSPAQLHLRRLERYLEGPGGQALLDLAAFPGGIEAIHAWLDRVARGRAMLAAMATAD